MPERRDLSDFERGVIVGARLAGSSVTTTAKLADVSRGTVSKVMSAWESEGKTSSAKGNCGRKRKLQDGDVRELIQSAKKNSRATVEQLTASVNQGRRQPVSSKTVRRELHRAGYQSRLEEDEPLNSPDKARKRGKKQRLWTTEQCGEV